MPRSVPAQIHGFDVIAAAAQAFGVRTRSNPNNLSEYLFPNKS
jgi:hypothetical protein